MKQFILLLFTLLALTILSGCSKDDNLPPVAAIDGTWKSPSGVIVKIEKGVSSFEEIDIDNAMYVSFTLDDMGTKTLQINDQVVQKLDIELLSFTDTPLIDSKVQSYNDSKKCGFDDWELNIAKDITECVRPDFDATKDIFLVEQDKLITGDINQIGTDGYPDALDYSNVLIRQ